MIRITEVHALPKHTLALKFSDGTSGVVELREHLDEAPLTPLIDERLFAKPYVDVNTVTWKTPKGELDIAPEFLYALAHGLPPPGSYEDTQANEREVRHRELAALKKR